VAGRSARVVQFLVQLGEFGVSGEDLFLEFFQLITGGRGVLGHCAGGIDHPLQQWRQVFERVHFGNLAGALFEVVLEVGAGVIHRCQLINEC
jgi:hypothetical protein